MSDPPVPDVSPEVPTATWRLVLRLIRGVPERALSRSFGRIADLPLPKPARRAVLGTFARAVGIDVTEAENPLDAYPTLNAFFVRRLRAGARSWPDDPDAITSPVDGIVGRSGRIDNGRAIQAKGHSYLVRDLLGGRGDTSSLEGGTFLTIYLSPRHYHRIHTPCRGTVPEARYVPGALFPVNAPAVMHIRGLFARNERLICNLDTAHGRIAVVAVGAYNVGRISAAFDPTWSGTGKEPWVTNRRPTAPLQRTYAPPKKIEAGEEIMAFHLGSTIVLLFSAAVPLNPALQPGTEVRVGQPLTIS